MCRGTGRGCCVTVEREGLPAAGGAWLSRATGGGAPALQCSIARACVHSAT
jgi:hypothetical protein